MEIQVNDDRQYSAILQKANTIESPEPLHVEDIIVTGDAEVLLEVSSKFAKYTNKDVSEHWGKVATQSKSVEQGKSDAEERDEEIRKTHQEKEKNQANLYKGKRRAECLHINQDGKRRASLCPPREERYKSYISWEVVMCMSSLAWVCGNVIAQRRSRYLLPL